MALLFCFRRQHNCDIVPPYSIFSFTRNLLTTSHAPHAGAHFKRPLLAKLEPGRTNCFLIFTVLFCCFRASQPKKKKKGFRPAKCEWCNQLTFYDLNRSPAVAEKKHRCFPAKAAEGKKNPQFNVSHCDNNNNSSCLDKPRLLHSHAHKAAAAAATACAMAKEARGSARNPAFPRHDGCVWTRPTSKSFIEN